MGGCGIQGGYNLGFFTLGLDYLGIRDKSIGIEERVANNLDAGDMSVLLILGIALIILINKNKKDTINK
ncbi:hypothetical protein HAHI6034_10140 [Hathewaya histolytica]|uniref:Uncharacterized protein n=1 Tax=Hathewaya histolytica TaxID=1498 RepID=A0A4V6KBR5_HATHI|nr:hypothetical protein [Hathewaya histolytica]VTQ83247.1 Uncharacterised protein [Hathewaya histolytica]